MQSNKIDVKYVFFERTKLNKESKTFEEISINQRNHFKARLQSEFDVFHWFLKYSNDSSCKKENVDYGWFSTEKCLKKINTISPDLILVYGTSIIKGDIINLFKNRIINLHLGLSPYYRGAGTNYFPFVNSEPEFCGATFMYLDKGIDTGEIIHQLRPNILENDSFHQFSNRFLVEVFNTYVNLIENFQHLKQKKSLQSKQDNFYIKRYYKKSDFTDLSLEKLNNNFKKNMIKKYLMDKVSRDKSVEIITQEFLL